MVTFPRRSDRPSLTVATSAYGRDVIARFDQTGVLSWLAEAGADAVELRRELLPAGFTGFNELGEACRHQGLGVVYSAADTLWDGERPAAGLGQRLAEADALGAVAVKFSLGRYARDDADWAALGECLSGHACLVLIENDQTAEGGTLAPLIDCLNDAERRACPLYLTFDIGNWHWTGEDVEKAASRLARYVRYVHCKGIAWHDGRPHAAVPSAEEYHEWRALMTAFPAGVPRAIEYPLQGDDPTSLTRNELARLARL